MCRPFFKQAGTSNFAYDRSIGCTYMTFQVHSSTQRMSQRHQYFAVTCDACDSILLVTVLYMSE